MAAIDEDAPSRAAIEGFYTGMLSFWHPVLRVAELDGPRAVRLLGRRLVLARLGDAILVAPDTCRHFQAQLSLGTIVDLGGRPGLQCAYHGWTFGAGGRCLRIPQLPQDRAIPAAADLPAFRAQERYGLI